MAAPDLDWWKDLLGEALKGQPRRWRRGGQLNSNQPQAPEFSEGGGANRSLRIDFDPFQENDDDDDDEEEERLLRALGR